jgi:hypothetical protein
MWVALIVVVLIVIGATVAVLRRPRGSDLTSVERYHSALGTIEHLSNRPGPSVRVVGTPAAGGMDPRTDPRGIEGEGTFPDPSEPLVFEDADPRDARLGRTDRAQRYALDSMNRRPRRGTPVTIIVLVVVLFGALAYIGSRHSGSGPKHSGTATPPTTSPARTPSDHHGSDHGHAKGGTHKTTPTTTVPSQVVALSSTGVSAVYPVADHSYTVVISASALCWVDATNASSGSTVWTGTLQAGASQVIQGTGAVKVELGAPSFTMTLDNVPVVLPNPVHTPFVATFQPSTPTSTAPVTPTTAGTVPATSASTG